MLSIKIWQSLSAEEQQCSLERPRTSDRLTAEVADTIARVRANGDSALRQYTQKFDGIALNSIHISQGAIESATIAARALDAIKQAMQTISAYHRSQIPETSSVSTAVGINITTTYRPIQKIGLYVPGGNNTPLVSSLLMQAIPAQVAGCPVKVLCTPPNNKGEIDPHLLVAARLCGIETIYSIGGAQAIAAMAYGTETVTKVDKLFGPGNSFVTEAKTLVAADPSGAAIDMPAGPSEVLISADAGANPAFVAADLLAQAEHGVDSHVLLLCDTLSLAQAVNQQLERQCTALPRKEIIARVLANSCIIVCSDINEQLTIINSYAPEHLIINRQDADSWVSRVTAAGTIFLGPWAAETMGDYVTGSNHVLPTNGYARNHNGLGTLDFLNRITVQSINQEGLKKMGPAAVTLAQIEGLDAHAHAVTVRLNALEL